MAPCVHVRGGWIPRSVFGRLHVLCAWLRMLWAALCLVLWERDTFDVFVVDLVSVAVPLLRIGGVPVLFYCHYPDKLLCVERASWLKRLYRVPFDALEESTTGAADRVLVNSKFTAGVFREAFPRLGGAGQWSGPVEREWVAVSARGGRACGERERGRELRECARVCEREGVCERERERRGPFAPPTPLTQPASRLRARRRRRGRGAVPRNRAA